MAFVIGTDEAGYGPNLGPLVIGASAWEMPDDLPLDGMYEQLADGIAIAPKGKVDRRLVIADSKQLYKGGGSLAPLERAMHTALALVARPADSWARLWPALDDQLPADVFEVPWHAGHDEPLPIAVPPEEVTATHSLVAACLSGSNVQMVDLQASVLFPREYNAQVRRCDNKAEVLSLTTLRLVRRLLAKLPAGKVRVVCDKHGGRDYYAAVLQHVFESFVRIRKESRELGVYELRLGEQDVEFHFLMKGERVLPTALASVIAKYLRELAMRPFNAFWQQHVPGLQATAGYYVDACRFREEIRLAQASLKIEDDLFWRER